MNSLPPGYQQLMQQMLGGQNGMPLPQGSGGAGMQLGPSFVGPDMANGGPSGVPNLPPAQPGDMPGNGRQLPPAQPGDAAASMQPMPNIAAGSNADARQKLIQAILASQS